MAAAYELQQAKKEHRLALNIVLVEASGKLGGKIDTVRSGEFLMEAGADSIVARKPNVAPYLDALGLTPEVVYNATGKSFIYTNGKLKLIPADSVFGIPASLESLAKSELVSAEGKVAALKDFYTRNEHFTINDSIGKFLRAFLGEELVDKQISPVLSGVYSGDLDELTIASTLPYLLDYKNKYGSIIQGLSENRTTFLGSGERKFLSFKQGVSALVERLEERLAEVDIRKGVRAEKIEKNGDRYTVCLANRESIEADVVVLSPIHTAAQRLLRSAALDEYFNQLKNNSMISVYVGFDVDDSVLPENGTGFIVADSGDVTCNACTWTSRKWAHTSKNKRLLVRLFYKGPAYEALRGLPEDQLLNVAQKDIALSLGVTAKPVTSVVTPWDDAMPMYRMGHRQIVEALEQKMAEMFPNVYLAGCSYYGVGIPDCIENGRQTARQIVGLMKK